jgi:hypothetical protein
MKTFSKLLILCFISVVAGSPDLYAQGADWNGIRPLKSTRGDVEAKLGKPQESGWYVFPDETVRFRYSEYGCGEIETCYCLVPKDTVIEISVNLLSKRKLKEFNLDLSQFEKEADSHLLVYDYYTSEEIGVTYTVVRESATVTGITYFPSKKSCSSFEKTNTTSINRTKFSSLDGRIARF